MSVLEKVLRKFHLVSVIIIILVELAFLVAVVSCCSIQSKSKKLKTSYRIIINFFFLSDTQGQILAALLIVLSFLALMALIYFLRKYLFHLLILIIIFPISISRRYTQRTG
jgi:hypothetical protein